jgi:hypothetical protein
VRTTIHGAGTAHIAFTLSTPKGTVDGDGDVTITYRGNSLICNGPARITSGTGAYSRFRSTSLRVSGRTPVDPETSTLQLSGPYSS